MKKFIALLAVLGLMFGLSACQSDEGEDKTRTQSEKLSEVATGQQMTAVPYPAEQLKDSLERRNLKERLLRQNKASKVGYVYILSFGKFIGYYSIKGKVSSTQSQMNPEDSISKWVCPGSCADVPGVITSSAGDDGSYGESEPGIFFFTTEGVMVQVSTDYIYSDSPIGVGGIPELNK